MRKIIASLVGLAGISWFLYWNATPVVTLAATALLMPVILFSRLGKNKFFIVVILICFLTSFFFFSFSFFSPVLVQRDKKTELARLLLVSRGGETLAKGNRWMIPFTFSLKERNRRVNFSFVLLTSLKDDGDIYTSDCIEGEWHVVFTFSDDWDLARWDNDDDNNNNFRNELIDLSKKVAQTKMRAFCKKSLGEVGEISFACPSEYRMELKVKLRQL